MLKLFVILGSINGFLAVALGAFGAHGLEGRIDDKLLSAYQTGVQYQMFHAAALLAVAILSTKFTSTGWIAGSGYAFLIGIILFSGSLYTMAFTGIRGLGIITPFGGVAFLVGWVLLLGSAIKS